MDDVREVRVYAAELREVQAVGKPYRYLEGRAVPYNTWQDVGPFMENHAEGSFAHSTNGGSGRSLPLIIGHDPHDLDNIVGHAERWSHDATGCYGVWKLNDSRRAQQAAGLATSGDLTGLSIGFQEVRAEPVRKPKGAAGSVDKPWILRTESRMLETSLTPVPAFPDAGVLLVRSMFDPETFVTEPEPTPELDWWRARLVELQ